MSLLTAPWLYLNLGCEMFYILDLRLRAQQVQPDKAAKVVLEILCAMFDSSFLDQTLFVPQSPFSVRRTRHVFDRLAHVSIMRLNASSMDKLFDLMMMGVKYQLLCCASLDALAEVTATHIAGVRGILRAHAPRAAASDAERCLRLLRHADEAAAAFYGALSQGQLALLRQTLARFFQDRRAKASLLLAEGIQAQDGRICLPSCVHDRVGVVRSFGAADGRLEAVERLPLAALQHAHPEDFFCHTARLGENLYAADRHKMEQAAEVVGASRELGVLGSLLAIRSADGDGAHRSSSGADEALLLDLFSDPTDSAPRPAWALPEGAGGDAGDAHEGPPRGERDSVASAAEEHATSRRVVVCGAPCAVAGRGNEAYESASGIRGMLEALSVGQEGEGGGDALDLLELMDSATA